MSISIAVDIDGILSEFNLAAHAILSSQCPMRPLPPDGPSTWSWYEPLGATRDAVNVLNGCMKTDAFWEKLFEHKDMTPRAETMLYHLIDKYEVSFVTSRPVGQKVTIDWLERHFLLSAPQVVIVPSGRKAMVLAGMEPRILIEDSGTNVLDFIAAETDYRLPSCLKILVSRPYNRKYHNRLATDGVRIVESTEAALSLALTMAPLIESQKVA